MASFKVNSSSYNALPQITPLILEEDDNSLMWSKLDTPPEAISGISVLLDNYKVASILGPDIIPALEISL